MGSIIIGFSKPKKFKLFAWIIMKTYGIPYDHVYIKFWSETFQRNIIYQASQLMVNFMGEEYWLEENIAYKEFPVNISDDNRVKMVQFAMDQAGKPYGLKSAFGLLIVRIFDLFGKKIKNPLGDGKKTYICCELGAYVLDEFTDVAGIDTDTVNPKELYELLLKLQESGHLK